MQENRWIIRTKRRLFYILMIRNTTLWEINRKRRINIHPEKNSDQISTGIYSIAEPRVDRINVKTQALEKYPESRFLNIKIFNVLIRNSSPDLHITRFIHIIIDCLYLKITIIIHNKYLSAKYTILLSHNWVIADEFSYLKFKVLNPLEISMIFSL